MTSNKHYDSDEIPELSPHHSGVYDEDQLGKNELKNNSMIELELARLRITQLEKEIELEKLRCQRCEGSGQSVSNSENTILKNLYLPKREVIRFDGTPTNYWNFIRNFEVSENIGFRAKLNYLIQYCDGEAKAAILHCTILEPEIGYHQALKLLEETFGQKHVVARTFIDNLLNFPNIRRNQPDGLRRLSREMQACSLTLEQMNYVSDLNSSRTIETMVLKLPTHIQQEWLKVAYKIIRGGREPLFTDLVDFVKEQADIANTRYGLLVNRGSNSDDRDVDVLKRKISTDYNAARISYESASDDNALLRSSSCLECSSNHSLDQCQKFKDKNVRERKEFVLRHKLCNVCLKANHVAKNCRSPRSCAVEGCGWRHHTLLHELREEPRNTNIDAHINTQLCTEKSVESVQKHAAFAIVPVLVRNGEKVAQTCAFLDSGSDASLITEDLAKRLNLEGEPKTISLRTLDNHSTIQCKEVQLEVSSLDSSSSFRIPNVWTVERLPMLRRTVPTTSQMKSWTHLKDISFSRVEDENVELLIGCNAPSVHEMKEVRTGKPNEPFAVKTLLGWTLFGSYGEPCKSNRVLNHLSAKEELEDKFEQSYSTEFKDRLSRTSSMSVEDRIASSESAYGVAGYTRSEDVSRQVHCSFLLTKYKVVKPKTEASSANKSKSTLRKLKEKDIKLKVKTTKKPKTTVTKKPVTKTLKKQVAHIRRGIEDGVEKGALVRVVNKSKGASGSSIGSNAILRQIMCSWNQNKTVNALLERGCEWRFKLPRSSQRDGVWGRIIKSIRRILRSLLFRKVLMDESSRDLVLLNNVGSLRSLWSKAIVEQVSYGFDGRVRTAKLRTSNEETARDVRRLCLLEGASCLTATTTLDNGRGARFGGSVKCD
ncbi:unnamed protein product [Schistosoma haematobium]|nr:unnamed protein product [Schistosoma haematobium]